MSKTQAKKMEEKRVTPLGLKFNPPPKATALSQDWEKYIASQLGIESSLDEALNQISKNLRWWGESYGYFSKKSDAVYFAQYMQYLINSQIVLPGEQILRAHLAIENNSGTNQPQDADSYYIDPETLEIKSDHSAARPRLVEQVSTNSNASLETCPVAIINPVEFGRLDFNSQLEAVRHIVVSLHIWGFISSYPSHETALHAKQSRPINIIVDPNHDLIVRLGAGIALGELAKALGKYTSAPSLGTAAKFAKLEDSISKTDSRMISYLDHLVESYGQFGKLEVLSIDYPLSFVSEPTVVTKAAPIEPPVKLVKTQSEQQQDEQEMRQAQPVLSLPTPVQPKPVNNLNSRTHEFNIAGVQGYISIVISPNQQPNKLHIGAYKADFTTLQFLATVSLLSSKLLQRGAKIEEIAEVLSGLAFEPATSEHKSILDYCSKWLQQFSLTS